jgi:hypothetical protein
VVGKRGNNIPRIPSAKKKFPARINAHLLNLPFVFLIFKKISPSIYLKYLKENSFSIKNFF